VKATRWKCTCAYDGGAFDGWQSQPGANAVQDIIEARLLEILKTPTRIHGSGRTDAGVHALAQVFHFDAVWRHGPEKLMAAFRMGLPEKIQISSVRAAPDNFHARFDAKGKRYEYHISLGDTDPFARPYCWIIFKPLEIDRMKAAAVVLVGRHDFTSFTALNGSVREDAIRNLRRLDVTQRGRKIVIAAEADGFLYKMVRSLVGALVAAGEGKMSPAQLRMILEAKHRTQVVKTAPPQGLFLKRVFY
jgi:tRNA pseudouridine38-40 synthase